MRFPTPDPTQLLVDRLYALCGPTVCLPEVVRSLGTTEVSVHDVQDEILRRHACHHLLAELESSDERPPSSLTRADPSGPVGVPDTR